MASTPIKRPVFVLGFPRTGTTLLQNLLDQEPGRRALQFWELTRPVPGTGDPAKDERHRVAWSKWDIFWAYKFVPEMREMHHIGARTTEECWPLMMACGSALTYDLAQGQRDFGDWLLASDMVGAYRDYRSLLQIMLSHQPADQLVIKCPEHLWFLDALLEVFPDACIVWTHREPVSCIASYCSMVSLNIRTAFGRYDPHEIGSHSTKRFYEGVTRAMAVRDRVGEDRFMDVDFLELVRDPLGKMAEISERFDLKTTEVGRQNMEKWLATERGDSRGNHRYSAERYGLDEEQIEALFSPYTERFGLKRDRTA